MECVFCSGSVSEEWSLGELPPSDTFSLSKAESLNVVCEQLSIGICSECGLTQNTEIVSEQLRYEETDYAYNSANSDYAKQHWAGFVDYLQKNLNNQLMSKVLEIGSNDGYCAGLLKSKEINAEIYGVDASGFQVARAAKIYKDIEFRKCIFGIDPDEFEDQSFDLIYANNVVNHANKLHAFLSRAACLLNDGGRLVFEVPLLDLMFINEKWDQIYHEHVSYFSVNSILTIISKVGLKLSSLEINDYHGGSARVTCSKESFGPAFCVYGSLGSTANNIKQLKSKAEEQKKRLSLKISEIKKDPYAKIYFFGAPAKGVTFINYCGLTSDMISGCLENSVDKIGKFIPKSGIPILDEKSVENGSFVINLLWNIPDVYDIFCMKNNLVKVSL